MLEQEATAFPALVKDILQLQAQLSTVIKRHHDACVRINRYQAALSSARLLPPELVRRIFLLCTEGYNVKASPSPNIAPLSLAQICSGWREVAVTTPELWKDIAFQADSPRSITNFKELAQVWFSRCYTKPVSLAFSSNCQLETAQNLLLDVVAPYSTYIESLELRVATAFFRAFTEYPPEAFPRLRCIRFHGTRTDHHLQGGWRLWDSATAPFQFAPHLKEVFISIPETRVNLEDMNLPWSQLSSLHLAESIVAPGAMLRVLALCSNLVSCSVRLVADSVISSVMDVTLPSLASFSLHMETGELADFLRCLSVPAIQSLSLHLVPNATWHPDALIHLLSRSQCRLDHLSISGLTIDPDGFIELLHIVPTLQVLDIMFVSFMTDEVLGCMTPTTVYEDPALPLLKVFKWREISLKCSPGHIRKFITSRGWSSGEQATQVKGEGREGPKVVRLESLVIRSKVGHFGSEWKENLEEFKNRGLDLSYGMH